MSIYTTRNVTPAAAREILHRELTTLLAKVAYASDQELHDWLNDYVAGRGEHWDANFSVVSDD